MACGQWATCHIISERWLSHYKVVYKYEVGIPVLNGVGDNVLPKKFEPIGFCDSCCRNPRSDKIFYFAVAHELLLKDVEYTLTPHQLFR